MGEDAALRQAVGDYLDGLHTSDAGLLARVFLPEARLYAVEDGKVMDLPLADWLARVRTRPNFRAQGIAAPSEILQIDQESPTTGFARLTSTVPPWHFLDYLNFLKIDGQWRIVSKLYHRYG